MCSNAPGHGLSTTPTPTPAVLHFITKMLYGHPTGHSLCTRGHSLSRHSDPGRKPPPTNEPCSTIRLSQEQPRVVAGDPAQHTPAGHGRICGHLAHRQRRLLKPSLLELRPRALKSVRSPRSSHFEQNRVQRWKQASIRKHRVNSERTWGPSRGTGEARGPGV